MKEKIVIVTVACNKEYYYICAKNLIENFIDDEDYQVIVYTDNEDEFKKYTKIKIIHQKYQTTFPYHNKFSYINEIRKMGYEKICFIDADMYLFDKTFKDELKLYEFNSGYSYSRYTGMDFNYTISNNSKFNKFKEILDKRNEYYLNIVSPWEDICYFNFGGINETKLNLLFEKYNEYRDMRESCAATAQDDLKGEGIIFALASIHSDFPMHSSKFLFNSLKYFRDNHIPKYKDIDSIAKEVDFIILLKNDEQEKMYNITVDFYKERFPQTKFHAIQNNPENVINMMKHSNNKVCIIVDSGSIMIDCNHIQNEMEMVLRGQFDYVIPFSNKYELPQFVTNSNHFTGMYIVNRLIFIETFENNLWTSDKDRYDRLIEKNVKYKKTWGDLLCLDETNPVIKNKLM